MTNETLKLSHITIENFRAISKLDLPLDPQLTVLVGNNAAGKTTILDAIAVGLSAVITHLPELSDRDVYSTQGFRSNDLQQAMVSDDLVVTESPLSGIKQAPYVRVTVESMDGVIWDMTKERDQTKRTLAEIPPEKRLNQLHDFLDQIINDVQDGKPTDLPVIAYYGTERAVLSLSQRDFNKNFNRFNALEDALVATQPFQGMIEWFAFQEDLERREREQRKDFEYRRPILEAVRRAISQMIPGSSEPRTLINPLRFVVTLNSGENGPEMLSLEQLSDGYRTTLALVMDLARRMAQANPHRSEKAIDSEAIVLIDEVDLHLHPMWQQHILVDLMATFANTQFIVTTHSPQLLTTIKPKHIVRLEREHEVIAEQVMSSYGAESGRLLAEIMEVDERPPAVKSVKESKL